LFAVLAKGVICDYKFYGRHSRKFKFAGLAAYSSSKGAVITLSELLAEGYKEQGISLMFCTGFCANRNAGRSFSRLSSAYIKQMKWQIIFLILL
jgi:NAD(P)-dependent dehydrogenase (short-subunit alcohol dehydrogenase family)